LTPGFAHVLHWFSTGSRKLNIGCGHERRDGFINLDLAMTPAVDVRADMLRLPFASGSIDTIAAQDVLEHVEIAPAMRELARVLRPGGTLVLQAVHFTSRDLYVDPTHVRGYSHRTFDFFAGEGRGDRDYYFDFRFATTELRHVQFHTNRLIWNRPLERWVNRSDATRDAYELTGLSRLFPAANVIAVLRR
jgi:SAM-dependent methyltransferase